MSRNIEAKIFEYAEKPANELGFELVDVEFKKEGKEYILYIYIDKPGGVNIDDCQCMSERLDTILDEQDPISQSYCLCVSSPGLDRPLKKDKDFEKAVGKQIEIKLFKPHNNKKIIIGKLISYDDEAVYVVDIDDEITVLKKDIALAKLYITF